MYWTKTAIKFAVIVAILSQVHTVSADCQDVTITAPSQEDSIEYQIQKGNAVLKSFTLKAFTTSDLDCFDKNMYFMQPNNGSRFGSGGQRAFQYNKNTPNKMTIQTSNNDDESYGDEFGWVYIVQRRFTNIKTGETVTHNTQVNVKADCGKESIVKPSSIDFTNLVFEYKIYTKLWLNPRYDWVKFTTTRESCQISQYKILREGSYDPSFAITHSTGVRIYAISNLYGDNSYQMTLQVISNTTGSNIQASYTFTVNTIKDCPGALSRASILTRYYNYTVGKSAVQSEVMAQHDEYCNIQYNILYLANHSAIGTSSDAKAIMDNGNLRLGIYCTSNTNTAVATSLDTVDADTYKVYVQLYLSDDPDTKIQNTDRTFSVYVTPNCNAETLTAGSTSLPNVQYTIFQGQLAVSMPSMTSSLAYCVIYRYSAWVNGTRNITDNNAAESRFWIDKSDFSSPKIIINLKSNKDGNTQSVITFIATQIGQVQATVSFKLDTKKDCQYAQITAHSQIISLSFEYTVTKPQADFQIAPSSSTGSSQYFTSNDTYCPIEYELYYQTNADQSGQSPIYSQFIQGTTTHSFIKNFDSSTSPIKISVQNDDATFLQGYESLDFKIIVRAITTRAENGVEKNDVDTTHTITMNHWCVRVVFENTTQEYLYAIRNSSQEIVMPRLNYSWVDSSKSESDIKATCGSLTYSVWNVDTNAAYSLPNDIFQSIQAFTNSADGNNYIRLVYFSSDHNLAGGIFGQDRISSKDFKAYIIGYLNGGKQGFPKAAGRIDLTLKIFDDCWVTQIITYDGNPIPDQRSTIKRKLTYQIPKFQNTAQHKFTNHSSVPDFSCGDLNYELRRSDGQALDPQWNFIDPNTNIQVNYFSLYTDLYDNANVLEVYVDKFKDRGTYDLAIYAWFQRANYTLEQNNYFPIKVEVNPCEIQSVFDESVIQNRTYNLFGGFQVYIIDFSKLYQIPDCEYTPIYTSSVQGDITGGYVGSNDLWPKYMNFSNSTEDPKSSMRYQILNNNISMEHLNFDFYFQITFINELDPNQKYIDKIIKIPWRMYFVYFPYNTPPLYFKSISSRILNIGQKLQFTTGPASNDTTDVEWSLKDSFKIDTFNEFAKVQVDRNTYEVTFDISPFAVNQIGTYDIQIRIVDEDPPAPKPITYKFFIVVKQISTINDELIQEIQEEKEEEKVTAAQIKLKMQISSMNNRGQLALKFNLDMNQTKFQDLKDLSYDQLRKVLLITIIPSPGQDQSKVGLSSYSIVSFSSKQIKISLNFTNPRYISTMQIRDQLLLEFFDQRYVRSMDGQSPSILKIFFKKVPEQFDTSGGTSFTERAMEIQAAMQQMTITSLLTNIAWQGPINYVWGMINTLQITAHSQLINTQVPTNLGIFNNITMKLIYFDILPDKGLQYFYFWNIFDGSYIQNQDEDETASIDNSSTRRLLIDKDVDEIICEPQTLLQFCQLEFENTKIDKIKLVQSILDQRDKSEAYTDEQIEQLAGYIQPQGSEGQQETQLERMAYGSISIIENMGTVFVLWEIFFIWVAILQLLKLICCPIMKIECIKKYYNQLHKSLFWGSFLRFGLEIYMEAAVAVQINLINQNVSTENDDEQNNLHDLVSYVYAIILAVFLVLFPIIIIIFLLKSRTVIVKEQKKRSNYLISYRTDKTQMKMDEQFEYFRKYSTIFLGLKSKTNMQILFYPIFLIRRLLLSVILVQLEAYPQFQILLMCYLNLSFIMYLGYIRPLEVPSRNNIEIFGEVMNMLTCYNFFVFTEFVPDLETRFNWAFTSIFYVTVTISVNMIFIAIEYINTIIKNYKRYIKNKQQKQRYQKYLEDIEVAKNAQNKRLQKLKDVYERQQYYVTMQQKREYAKNFPQETIIQELKRDNEIVDQIKNGVDRDSNLLVMDPTKQVRFHTQRFSRFNRFASLVNNIIQKQQKGSEDQFQVGKIEVGNRKYNFQNKQSDSKILKQNQITDSDKNNQVDKISTIMEVRELSIVHEDVSEGSDELDVFEATSKKNTFSFAGSAPKSYEQHSKYSHSMDLKQQSINNLLKHNDSNQSDMFNQESQQFDYLNMNKSSLNESNQSMKSNESQIVPWKGRDFNRKQIKHQKELYNDKNHSKIQKILNFNSQLEENESIKF